MPFRTLPSRVAEKNTFAWLCCVAQRSIRFGERLSKSPLRRPSGFLEFRIFIAKHLFTMYIKMGSCIKNRDLSEGRNESKTGQDRQTQGETVMGENGSNESNILCISGSALLCRQYPALEAFARFGRTDHDGGAPVSRRGDRRWDNGAVHGGRTKKLRAAFSS